MLLFLALVSLLLLALVVPSVRVARRSTSGWVLAQVAVMGATAVALVVFLFQDDDYRRDGTSNVEAYDVEYPAVPTLALLLLGAWWLGSRPATRGAALAAPLLAVTAAFGVGLSFLFTTN